MYFYSSFFPPGFPADVLALLALRYIEGDWTEILTGYSGKITLDLPTRRAIQSYLDIELKSDLISDLARTYSKMLFGPHTYKSFLQGFASSSL